jgi:hypothetical protein
MTEFPKILRLGYLEAFEFDIQSQQVRVVLSHAHVDGHVGSQTVRVAFHEVMHLTFTGDLPVVFGQNEVDTFEERDPSPLLQLIEKRNGYNFFVSEVYTTRLSWSKSPVPTLHHVFLHSAFMGAEWLCTDLTCSIEPQDQQ